MIKIQKLFLTLLLVSLTQIIASQNNTNSPYTRFGFGGLTDDTNGEQRAMGGTSLGARAKSSINFSNPASYSTVDSMTFMLDVGVSGLYSSFHSGSSRSGKFTGNIEYISLQIPLWKRLGFSVGVIPYSFAGYNFYTVTDLPYESFPDTVKYTTAYSGTGGISQVYGGLSYNFFNHISLGVNAYYMFGSALNSRSVIFTPSTGFHSSYQSDSLTVSNFRLRYGLQAFNTFGKNHEVSLGVIYEMKKRMNARYSERTGSVKEEETPFQEIFTRFDTPQMFGIGLNYTYNKQLTLAADYTLQQWENAAFMGATDTLANRSKIAVGAEFMPNPRSPQYFNRVLYRVGFNVSDAYYKIDGKMQPKNFGITFGFGFPIRSIGTVFNTSFEYGKIGTSGSLREDYFKISINAVFRENWFFRRRL